MSGDRAKVIAINKSIRTIKNELEALSERNAITDEQYDTLVANLPQEATLHNVNLPIPPIGANAASSPVTTSLGNLSLNHRVASPTNPPSNYNTSSPTPPLPSRNTPAPSQPQRPEIAHAVALYAYRDSDPRDCDLEPNDHISVHKYVNNEWWEGTNIRTGAVGIFPMNYVRVEAMPSSLAPNGNPYGADVKQPQGNYFQGYPQQKQENGPPPAGSPYSSAAPPMAMANQPTNDKPGKGQEMGKKFGKKLGNAAIFGAGATIGGSIVNSIF